MKTWMKSMATAVAVAGLVLAVQQAQAGCGMPEVKGSMKPTAYFGDSGGRLLKTGVFEGGGPFNTAAITGLWKFEFVSDGRNGGPPPGGLADSGFVTWHDDGTELMNSGRAAVAGDFCMGVWKQVGALTYKLNHWALSWIPAYVPGETSSWSNGPLPAPGPPPAGGTSVGGTDQAFVFAGPTNIQETVTLSRDGTQYTGTFKLIQYNPVPGAQVTAYDPSNIATVITGTVSATRVTVD
ncbi:MAG TPA: hypothetical protein VMB48_02680 [Steroidobacteraceae bacterium]|nr:hypothetical protein [Steroidobacteraceae bacterium]